MIMAYTRMALACPRLGFKIQPQGLLQPRRQPEQIKLPSPSSSTRHFLQTAQRLCNCPGNDKKPNERSKDDQKKNGESAQGINGKSKECSAAGKNLKMNEAQKNSAEDDKNTVKDSKNDAKKPEASGQGKSKNSEAEKNNAKQCAHGGKDPSNESTTNSEDTPLEGAEGNNNKSKEKSIECAKGDSEKCQGSTMDSNDNDEECSECDASESEDNDESEFSEDSDDSMDDECDESKECFSSLKMPGCEDPASMCPDPCDDDEESDEIAAHVGGMCSKDPCGKLKEPCEGFLKKHIGSLLRHQEK